MKKFYAFFGNQQVLKVVFCIFVAVYLVFNGILLYLLDWTVGNNDNYKGMFEDFMQKGYYQSVQQGTSILYNCALQGIYTFVKDVDTSFFVLNLFGDLFLIFFGSWLCYKIAGKSKYFYIIVGFYALKMLTLKSYLRASNDTFLAIFVCLFLYFVIYKIFDEKRQYFTFALTGLLLSICLSIRMTAFLLLPILAIAIVYWIKNTKMASAKRFRLLAVMSLTALLCVTALHFPSLVTHQKLSYEDKNYMEGVNWTQRNYLGLKKIENGQEPMHRDAIWKKTSFNEVKDYLKVHGENSLPDSILKVMLHDPMLFLKMTSYNLLICVVEFFRFWGLLAFLPVLGLFRERFFAVSNLPMLFMVYYTIALSAVCFTFLEFRWFVGYEILFAFSALMVLDKPYFTKNLLKTNALIVMSLAIVTLINLKTIISKVHLLTT